MTRKNVSLILSLLLVIVFICATMLITAPRGAAQSGTWTTPNSATASSEYPLWPAANAIDDDMSTP